jgi:hypothetical protein
MFGIPFETWAKVPMVQMVTFYHEAPFDSQAACVLNVPIMQVPVN